MALIIEDGTVITNANTYATISYVTAYCDDRKLLMPNGDDVDGESKTDMEAAILRAMVYIESKPYKGIKTDRDNPLKWPRNGVEDIDEFAVESDKIPSEILFALARAFYEEIFEPNTLQPNIERDDVIKQEKIDIIVTEYFEFKSPEATQFVIIDSYLKGLLKEASSIDVERT